MAVVRSAKKKAGVVTGWPELDRKLAQFEPKIQKRIARDQLKKVTKNLVVVAGNNLQAAGHVEEGKLLASIKDGAGKRSRNKISRSVFTKGRDNKFFAFAGAQIELGRKGTAPDSFLRKALYENRDFIHREVINGIDLHIFTLKEIRKPG